MKFTWINRYGENDKHGRWLLECFIEADVSFIDKYREMGFSKTMVKVGSISKSENHGYIGNLFYDVSECLNHGMCSSSIAIDDIEYLKTKIESNIISLRYLLNSVNSI